MKRSCVPIHPSFKRRWDNIDQAGKVCDGDVKVTAIGTLTPAQQRQLAYDLLKFFYLAHRQGEKTRMSTNTTEDPSVTRHTPLA